MDTAVKDAPGGTAVAAAGLAVAVLDPVEVRRDGVTLAGNGARDDDS